MSRRWVFVFRSVAVLASIIMLGLLPAGYWPTVILFTLWAIGIRVVDDGREAAVFARQVRRSWT